MTPALRPVRIRKGRAAQHIRGYACTGTRAAAVGSALPRTSARVCRRLHPTGSARQRRRRSDPSAVAGLSFGTPQQGVPARLRRRDTTARTGPVIRRRLFNEASLRGRAEDVAKKNDRGGAANWIEAKVLLRAEEIHEEGGGDEQANYFAAQRQVDQAWQEYEKLTRGADPATLSWDLMDQGLSREEFATAVSAAEAAFVRTLDASRDLRTATADLKTAFTGRAPLLGAIDRARAAGHGPQGPQGGVRPGRRHGQRGRDDAAADDAGPERVQGVLRARRQDPRREPPGRHPRLRQRAHPQPAHPGGQQPAAAPRRDRRGADPVHQAGGHDDPAAAHRRRRPADPRQEGQRRLGRAPRRDAARRGQPEPADAARGRQAR